MPEAVTGTLSWIKKVCCVPPLIRLSEGTGFRPLGLICAHHNFERKVDETLGDLPGVTGIADDIVVYGYDDRDHDKNLRAVLQRARETGLLFNLDKCKFKCARIPFFGHIIGADGLQPDPRTLIFYQFCYCKYFKWPSIYHFFRILCMHHARVSRLWTKDIDLTHQGQFLTPDSQIQTNCSLTHKLRVLFCVLTKSKHAKIVVF